VEYRTLGRSGLRVSVLGVGTWQLAGPVEIEGKPDGYADVGRDQVVRLIRELGDLGVNLVDTAPIYGDGEGERRVGEAIHGRRDAWVVVTKFGLARGPEGQAVMTANPPQIRRWLEESLGRLRTSHVDVYLIHHNKLAPDLEPTVRALEDLRKAGLIRAAGVSSDDLSLLHELERIAPIDVVMFSDSLLRRPTRIYEVLRRQRAGALIHGVLEQGRIGGGYWARAPRFGPEDFRSHAADAADFTRYSVLGGLAEAFGMTPVQLAVRTVLDREHTHSIVLGSTTLERYREAIAAVTLPALTGRQRARIDRAVDTLRPR